MVVNQAQPIVTNGLLALKGVAICWPVAGHFVLNLVPEGPFGDVFAFPAQKHPATVATQ